MNPPLKLGVLVSGRGSNLQSILNHIQSGTLPARVAMVISNNPYAPILNTLDHQIPRAIVEKKNFATRAEFELCMARILQEHQVDLVILAGFMHVLSTDFICAFPQKIMNIHPSLLPSFPGLSAQKQALDYGVKFAGCTVHFVNEQVDGGPIILQAVVPVLDNDTEETLSQRILAEEHRLLPNAIRLFHKHLMSSTLSAQRNQP